MYSLDSSHIRMLSYILVDSMIVCSYATPIMCTHDALKLPQLEKRSCHVVMIECTHAGLSTDTRVKLLSHLE